MTKKPALKETVTRVGRRLTKRDQTKVTTEYGDVYFESLDRDAYLNLKKFQAQAIAVLQAEGIQAEPIESALDRVRAQSRPNDGGKLDDDSLPGLAAQSLWNIHELELFEAAYGKPADYALQRAYSLGRLSVLMREVAGTSRQTREAAITRVPGSIETDGGKVTKEDLVTEAIAAAGAGAGSGTVWTQLLGILDSHGLNPIETGAKYARRITCEPLDDSGDITFNFGAFKTMVSRLKAAAGQRAARGRPRGK